MVAGRPRAPGEVLLAAPASSYRIPAYLEAAERIGVPLTVVSEGEHALLPCGTRGIHVRFDSPEAAVRTVLAALEGVAPCAVLASDDGTVEFASRVAAALRLPHNPPRATRISRRKDLARQALSAAGLPVPAFRLVDLNGDIEGQVAGLDYPCVVKPLAMSGSRGVIRADDRSSVLAAIERAGAIASESGSEFERGNLLVEGFIPGAEVALEGMLEDGHLRVLALFDKPEPLDGPFFEESYYVTPSRLPPTMQNTVARRVAECCAAYGLHHGPVHAELRLHDGDAWPLEVAARTIGGECARLLSFGTGCGLEELVLRQALGEHVQTNVANGAAGVLMLPTPRAGILRRVQGVLEAQRIPGIEEVSIAVREGYRLVPLPEGSSYLGFVFARSATPAEVESALRQANRSIEVVTAPLLALAEGVRR